MNIPWREIGEAGGGIIILGGAVLTVIRLLKERRARKLGLQGNPKRCIDAEKRIMALEVCQAKFETKLDSVEGKVNEVRDDVKTLIRLHLGEK